MFTVYFQPIFDRCHAPLAHEALLRIPSLPGCIGLFVQKLEQHQELIHLQNIHNYVLEKVISYTENGFYGQMWINCSARLIYADYINYLLKFLDEHDVHASTLGIEVTETFLITDLNDFQYQLSRLHDAGLRIILDDFGSGYQSLHRFISFPFDYVKISGALIKESLHSARTKNILASMIHMFHNCNAKVIAESVENEMIFRMMLNMNCDGFQGYWLQHPQPVPGEYQLDSIQLPETILKSLCHCFT